MTEDELLGMIIGPGQNNLCDLYGWKSYHARPAVAFDNGKMVYRTAVQGDGAGFLDLVLVSLEPRPKKQMILFRELKSDKGKMSDAQWGWHDALKAAGQNVGIWRPSQWEEIVKTLQKPIDKGI